MGHRGACNICRPLVFRILTWVWPCPHFKPRVQLALRPLCWLAEPVGEACPPSGVKVQK